MTEMLAVLPGVAYAARGSIADAASIGRTRQYLKKACEVQLAGTGFAIVEVLSNCPVGWGMTPVDSMAWLTDHVMPVYPVGVIVDRTAPTKPAGSVPAEPATAPTPELPTAPTANG
jgi:2-oxoglutarate ferredoxin oxidoreductase subunit beta